MIRTRSLALLLVVLLVSGGSLFAQEQGAAGRNGEPAKAPKTHVVKKGPFSVALTLEGVIEPANPSEIAVKLDEFDGDLVVAEVVPHGAAVEKGAVLVQFEIRQIDEKIEDQARAVDLARLELGSLENELASLERSQPLDLSALERGDRIAREDQERFETVKKKHSQDLAKWSLKASQNYLEYEQEELKQLERMYKADDLTEETEEIVLRRQRDAVEGAAFRFESAKLDHEQTLARSLPREEEAQRHGSATASVALEKAKVAQPIELAKKRIEVEKKRVELARAAAKLERLRADRATLDVRAPVAGVVYYGRFQKGQWTDAEAIGKKLRKGGEVDSGEVLMTVVDPAGDLVVRAKVTEANAWQLRPGLEGRIRPAGLPDVAVAAKVVSVSSILATPGNFECILALQLSELGAREPVAAGMAAKARFVVYRRDDALAVPAKALQHDEDEDADFLFVVKDASPPEKRYVRAGWRTADRVEIVEGIEEGTQVLLDRPE